MCIIQISDNIHLPIQSILQDIARNCAIYLQKSIAVTVYSKALNHTSDFKVQNRTKEGILMVDRRLPVFLKNMLINLIVRLFMLTFSGKFYDKN